MSTALQKWVSHGKSMRVVRQLYVGTLLSPSGGNEQSFLNLVLALEVYHRTVGKNCLIPEKEHEKRMSSILRSSPRKYEAWLKEELASSNSPELHDRLMDLINYHKEVFETFIWDTNWFANTTVKTRNYLTHRGKKTKHFISGDQLTLRIRELRAIIEICLLSDIGFKDPRIEVIIAGNWAYRELILTKHYMACTPVPKLPGWVYPQAICASSKASTILSRRWCRRD
jgi:hypothetical protein